MNAVNQPENTTKTNVRDAAVQIGGEEKGLFFKVLYHVEQGIDKVEVSKGELIRRGCEASLRLDFRGRDLDMDSLTNMAYGTLSSLCAMLTDQKKEGREYAKNEIRRFVKLGKGV